MYQQQQQHQLQQHQLQQQQQEKSSSSFISYAPCRLCWFGEHQDYLNLPVIACAIPYYCKIHVSSATIGNSNNTTHNTTTKKRRSIILRIPQLNNKTYEYDLDHLPDRQDCNTPVNERDFALAAIYDVLSVRGDDDDDDDGWFIDDNQFAFPIVCVSSSDMPMQAGCSTSSAFTVAFLQVLAKLCNKVKAITPMELYKLAYHAEVIHVKAPGGNMDHVTSAYGGLIRIGGEYNDNNNIDDRYSNDDDKNKSKNTNDRFWNVESFQLAKRDDGLGFGCWVLAYTGQQKDTFHHLHRCKAMRLELLENKLGGNWDAEIPSLSRDEQLLLKTTLINRNTELAAAQLIRSMSPEAAEAAATIRTHNDYDDNKKDGSNHDYNAIGVQLGELMTKHHSALRDGLQLSTDIIERIGQAAMKTGAWGFKLVGSGGGGCCCAWTSISNCLIVEQSMIQAGATKTWIIQYLSKGAYTQETDS